MLADFQKSKRKAFIPFVVAGYPSLKDSEKVIDILVKEGADLIELGVPFTDALADGPVIQNASEKAARENITLNDVLELSQTLRKKYPSLGLVLFSYFNPIFKMGLDVFSKKSKIGGLDAVLCVDLPPEESILYREILKKNDIGTVFLASPTTIEKRLTLIEEASSEFIYYVSRTGVTGTRSELSPTLEKELKKLRSQVKKPLAVGFGISNGKQTVQVAPFVDGIVVGSAFVKLTQDPDLDRVLNQVGVLAREIKLACGTHHLYEILSL